MNKIFLLALGTILVTSLYSDNIIDPDNIVQSTFATYKSLYNNPNLEVDLF